MTGDITVKHLLTKNLLQQPHPDACPLVLLGWLLVLERTSSIDSDILDALVRLLALPRTDADFDRLQSAMECRCESNGPIPVSAAHRIGSLRFDRSSYASPFLAFLAFVTSRFSSVAMDVSRSIGSKDIIRNHIDSGAGLLQRSRVRLLWPTAQSCILPYGPEDSFRGIVAWLPRVSHAVDAGIFCLVRILLILAREDILPFFTTSRTLLDSALNVLDAQCAAWGFMRLGDPYDEVKENVLPVSELLVTWMQSVSRHEQVSFYRPQAAKTVRLCMHTGYLLHELYSREIKTGTLDDSVRLLTACNMILNLGAAILVFIPDCQRPFLAHPDVDVKNPKVKTMISLAAEKGKEYAGPASRLTQMLLAHGRRERCAAPDCPTRMTFAANGRKMQFCTGCTFMAYCSKACETAGWKHSLLPHRAVCTRLRDLRDEFGIGRKGRAESPLSEEDVAIQAKREEIVALCEHLEALEEYERQTPGEFSRS
jgi:hypothetical protein